jgi:hypothetical protein
MSAPFKPAYYGEEFDSLPLKWKKIVRWVDVVAILLAVAFVASPFLFYKNGSK